MIRLFVGKWITDMAVVAILSPLITRMITIIDLVVVGVIVAVVNGIIVYYLQILKERRNKK